jgi:hypothetical protein
MRLRTSDFGLRTLSGLALATFAAVAGCVDVHPERRGPEEPPPPPISAEKRAAIARENDQLGNELAAQNQRNEAIRRENAELERRKRQLKDSD